MSEGAADVLPEVFSTRNSPQPHQVQHLEAAYIYLQHSQKKKKKLQLRTWAYLSTMP